MNLLRAYMRDEVPWCMSADDIILIDEIRALSLNEKDGETFGL